jgi:cyclic pyranopterin phosphate synthase
METRRSPQVEPIVDRFGRRLDYLRLSVTDRCNLQCAYCQPAEGVSHVDREEILRFEEIDRLARLFAGMGVTKVRLTGGEPLLRRRLPELVRRLTAIPGIRSLPMTTNGILLEESARPLRDAGLDRLNVSLDTLREDRFQAITRSSGVTRVLRGIEEAQRAGFRQIKVNVVLIRGFNDDEIFDFLAYADARDANVRFIEFMPFEGNGWSRGQFLPYREALERITARFAVEPLPRERASDPALEFRIPKQRGRFGFIASLSESFCATCTRLRLSADGKLRPCLHQKTSVDLKGPLRSGATDADLDRLIRGAAHLKQEAHPDYLADLAGPKVSGITMTTIGG